MVPGFRGQRDMLDHAQREIKTKRAYLELFFAVNFAQRALCAAAIFFRAATLVRDEDRCGRREIRN